ncbi:hypothetical protein C4D60_Mb04t23220 [Musa balbisiana]|uniref:Uncharacterized protein n=1 Tax=Musa balbisiana TaxID=52838 RepID=A0A4S8KE38_MUSBA|nr:hypothetical protein C4D60_Mb04t23220 [Musa balbisiana]
MTRSPALLSASKGDDGHASVHTNESERFVFVPSNDLELLRSLKGNAGTNSKRVLSPFWASFQVDPSLKPHDPAKPGGVGGDGSSAAPRESVTFAKAKQLIRLVNVEAPEQRPLPLSASLMTPPSSSCSDTSGKDDGGSFVREDNNGRANRGPEEVISIFATISEHLMERRKAISSQQDLFSSSLS